MRAPTGPPSHHGNRSSSSHASRLRRPSSSGVIVNVPVPVTTPSWRTPIERPGTHSVISIRSVSLIGPIAVTHSNRVPTPRVCSVTKRMTSASAIHSTCDSIGSMTLQTRSGGASYSALTETCVTRARARSAASRPPARAA